MRNFLSGFGTGITSRYRYAGTHRAQPSGNVIGSSRTPARNLIGPKVGRRYMRRHGPGVLSGDFWESPKPTTYRSARVFPSGLYGRGTGGVGRRPYSFPSLKLPKPGLFRDWT